MEDEVSPACLQRKPDEDGDEQVDGVAEQPLPEGCEEQTVQRLKSRVLMGVEATPGFLRLCGQANQCNRGTVPGWWKMWELDADCVIWCLVAAMAGLAEIAVLAELVGRQVSASVWSLTG